MTTLNRIRVVAVEGTRLTLHVAHTYGWLDDTDLLPSRTFALNLLWETVEGDDSSPLGQELAGPFFHEEESRTRAIVGRFLSCVGVIDRRNCDEMWRDSNHEGWGGPEVFHAKCQEQPSATYLIEVTDPRWLAHLTPGEEWDSTAYDQDEKVVVDPSWRTQDVLAIARGINADLAFDRLPILADALQDAGCEDGQLLGHCRGPGPHVRGCWGVDLLLRVPFDPRTLDAGKVRQVEVVFLPLDGGADRRPGARSEDPDDIAAVVAAVCSAQEKEDELRATEGAIWFTRRGEEPAELWFRPGDDPEWYEFRAGGRMYRVRRAEFVAALRRVGVELPLQ
jgi:hypothetical protein